MFVVAATLWPLVKTKEAKQKARTLFCSQAAAYPCRRASPLWRQGSWRCWRPGSPSDTLPMEPSRVPARKVRPEICVPVRLHMLQPNKPSLASSQSSGFPTTTTPEESSGDPQGLSKLTGPFPLSCFQCLDIQTEPMLQHMQRRERAEIFQLHMR